MPKKFKGENSKSAVARERKSSVREAEEREKKKKLEDEYWKDEDKHLLRKQGKKEDKDRKRQEQLERKQEAKLLLEQEEEKLGGKVKAATKVTHAQINELEEQRQKESEGATALPRGVVVGPDLAAQNPNHLLRERLEKGEIDARTVEEAIDVLSISKGQPEKHPEKRLKAAFASFEEREFPRLKAENTNLRQSQVKQLLRKEWMKSPENPMNDY